jgi:NAD(P)-dependent dehydrogenase (short-subunit alcohol dehydrogenase family)
VALTRALAREVGKDGILVNCVAPGFTMSEGVKQHPQVVEQLRDVSVAARTLQRDQLPEDVVGAVVYLAGPGSDFVTGQTIVIDGGQYFH